MKQNLILLHGLFGGLSNWENVIPYYEKKFNVHVPILPIYNTHEENILDHLVNYLEEYINAKNLKRIILIGNSLGGHIAILYAYQNADKVEKLVLTGSSGLYENYTIGSYPRRHDYSYIRERVAYTFYDPKWATRELVDEVFEILSDNKRCLQIIKTAKITQRNYVSNLLPKIAMPVLLIWGKDDRITPPTVAEDFRDMLPNAQLVYLPECGHAPMMEKSNDFNNALDQFFFN
ncbi:alpha/beta hydrolase [Olivibacter sp. CPCC 100613]|uniref:alpha/beta fold hydrolase n=1 Tax=Olivibacter sp. CPCC 100613 TaxID=3079931 RepID=UPI002FFB73A3